jgi:hypothetical protein
MDTNIQPSFIPKKPISQQPAKQGHHTSLFSLIATIVFITTLLLSGGVFGFEWYVNKSIEEKKQTLQDELNKFQNALVAELSRLDARFSTANDLLQKHLSLSEFFNVLGKATLTNVRFASFSFNNAESAKPLISLDGQTLNFTAVALQQQELAKPEYAKFIKDVVIANPNLDEKGNVSFSFNGMLDPQQLSYRNVIKLQGVTIASTTTRTVATTTPATATTTRATSTNTTRR